MKKLVILLALFVVAGFTVFAQDAVLSVSFDNVKDPHCYGSISAQKNSFFSISLIPDKVARYTFKLTQPGFVNLSCYDTANGARFFDYALYLSPGDNVELKADFNKPGFGIQVTGKGSKNNQPLMGLMEEKDEFYSFYKYKDTVPLRIIEKINTQQRIRESNLEKYVALYHPTQEYIRDWKKDIPYLTAYNYYFFKENNKYAIWDAYLRNYANWQKITDSLCTFAKLNNDEALSSIHYPQLISEFVLRENERLLTLAEHEPQAFYKEWYNTDTLTGKKLLNNDKHNLLREKITNKYFGGQSAEYLYSILIKGAVQEGDTQNIPEIFERFKAKYPHSDYINLFKPAIDTIYARRKQVLNDKMIFLADNGIKFNTLKEVVANMKGKTVLVDMWGTWCGPCREEIEKHSKSIREHFKGQNLDFLYIANYDLQNSEQWKKMIAYFNIEGIHIMANDSLTKDIMAKVKGQGFPTIFIIKKNGSVEQSRTQSPIDEDILFSQLEAALKE